MIPLDQQDYVKYYQMYKGNFYKGAAILRAQLTNPTIAEAIISTPIALATIYANSARSNVDALCANEMYYAGYGKQITEAFLASKGYTDNLATILNDSTKLYGVVNDESLKDYTWHNLSVTRNAFKGIQTVKAIVSNPIFRNTDFSLDPVVASTHYDNLAAIANKALTTAGYSLITTTTTYSFGRTCWANATYYFSTIASKAGNWRCVVVAVNLKTRTATVVFSSATIAQNFVYDYNYPVIKIDNKNERIYIAYIPQDGKTRLTALHTADNTTIFSEVSLNETSIAATYPIFDIVFNDLYCAVIRQATSSQYVNSSTAQSMIGYTTVDMTGVIKYAYQTLSVSGPTANNCTHQIYAQLGNIFRMGIYEQIETSTSYHIFRLFFLNTSSYTLSTLSISDTGYTGNSCGNFVPYIFTDALTVFMNYNVSNNAYAISRLYIFMNHAQILAIGGESGYLYAVGDIKYDVTHQYIYLEVKKSPSSTQLTVAAFSTLSYFTSYRIDLINNTVTECTPTDIPYGLPSIYNVQQYYSLFSYNYLRYIMPYDDIFNGLTFRSDISHLYNMLSDSKPGFVTEEDLQ